MNWNPISSPPPKEHFVLVACKSKYVSIDWIFQTSRLDSQSLWVDEVHDALLDDGHAPSFWAELPDEPPKPLSDAEIAWSKAPEQVSKTDFILGYEAAQAKNKKQHTLNNENRKTIPPC